jgi:hypothetical protein
MRYLPPPIPDPARATLDSRHEDVRRKFDPNPLVMRRTAAIRFDAERDSARMRARLLTVLLAKLKAAR